MTNVWFYWSKSTQLTSHMVTVLHQLTNQTDFLARYGPAREYWMFVFKQMMHFIHKGDQHEIAKQLRTGDPKLVNAHCIAHRLTLAAGQAAAVIPYLLKFKDLMGQLYRFYENSAVRIVEDNLPVDEGGETTFKLIDAAPRGDGYSYTVKEKKPVRNRLDMFPEGFDRAAVPVLWEFCSEDLPDGSFNFQVDGSFDVLDPNRNLEGIIGDVSVEDNLPVEEGGRRETSALRRYWRETESIGGGTADITRTSWLGSDGAAAMVGRNKGMVRTTSTSIPKHRQCPTDFDDLLFTEVMDTLNHNERPVCTKACEKGDHVRGIPGKKMFSLLMLPHEHVRSTFDALCQEASNAHDERIDRLITYMRLVQTFPLAQDSSNANDIKLDYLNQMLLAGKHGLGVRTNNDTAGWHRRLKHQAIHLRPPPVLVGTSASGPLVQQVPSKIRKEEVSECPAKSLLQYLKCLKTIPGFSGRDRQTPKGGDTRSEVSNRLCHPYIQQPPANPQPTANPPVAPLPPVAIVHPIAQPIPQLDPRYYSTQPRRPRAPRPDFSLSLILLLSLFLPFSQPASNNPSRTTELGHSRTSRHQQDSAGVTEQEGPRSASSRRGIRPRRPPQRYAKTKQENLPPPAEIWVETKTKTASPEIGRRPNKMARDSSGSQRAAALFERRRRTLTTKKMRKRFTSARRAEGDYAGDGLRAGPVAGSPIRPAGVDQERPRLPLDAGDIYTKIREFARIQPVAQPVPPLQSAGQKQPAQNNGAGAQQNQPPPPPPVPPLQPAGQQQPAQQPTQNAQNAAGAAGQNNQPPQPGTKSQTVYHLLQCLNPDEARGRETLHSATPEKNLVGCEEILEEWKRRWLAAQTPRVASPKKKQKEKKSSPALRPDKEFDQQGSAIRRSKRKRNPPQRYAKKKQENIPPPAEIWKRVERLETKTKTTSPEIRRTRPSACCSACSSPSDSRQETTSTEQRSCGTVEPATTSRKDDPRFHEDPRYYLRQTRRPAPPRWPCDLCGGGVFPSYNALANHAAVARPTAPSGSSQPASNKDRSEKVHESEASEKAQAVSPKTRARSRAIALFFGPSGLEEAEDSWACLMSNLAGEVQTVWNNVPSDGNCQFAAIADQLERVRGATVSHQHLRGMVVAYLRDHPTLPGCSVTVAQLRGDECRQQCDTVCQTSLVRLVRSCEGLSVRKNVAYDGNCQFASVADQLERVRGATVSHQYLRRMVVEYLRDNPTLVNGPTPFTVAYDRMVANLAREGLRVRLNVAVDGNCQYTSVADQLERVRGTTVSHQHLRGMVVAYLQDHPTLPGCVTGLSVRKNVAYGGNCQFASVADQLERFRGTTVSHKYLRRMVRYFGATSGGEEWAANLELMACDDEIVTQKKEEEGHKK
ncbi:hypothetical protein Bbelb_425030 [Branchiostoma belcheri]|nr:hypothetical protein Bbelb_425030 [Branchiostoma belcheri]